MAGHTSITRRSCVAALLEAATTSATLFLPGPSAALSSSFRCTEPYDQLSSAAPQPAAGREFQSRIAPDAGFTVCGCAFAPRKPRHSNSPVPTVGNDGIGALRPDRQPPGGGVGDVAVVDVEEVEHPLHADSGADEALGGRHLSGVQRQDGKPAQHLPAARGALQRRARRASRRPSRSPARRRAPSAAASAAGRARRPIAGCPRRGSSSHGSCPDGDSGGRLRTGSRRRRRRCRPATTSPSRRSRGRGR